MVVLDEGGNQRVKCEIVWMGRAIGVVEVLVPTLFWNTTGKKERDKWLIQRMFHEVKQNMEFL